MISKLRIAPSMNAVIEARYYMPGIFTNAFRMLLFCVFALDVKFGKNVKLFVNIFY